MESVVQWLAFGTGAFFLGVGSTLALLFALTGRDRPEDDAPGCLFRILVLIPVGMAMYLFYWAAQASH